MVRDLLKAAASYLRDNPQEVVKTAVNAAGLRFGVPIAGLAWLAGQVKGKKAPKDIEIGAVPPALRLSATIDAMGTQLRAAASVKIDEVEISQESIRIGLRVNDIKLKVMDDSETPVAMLVKSGALDLSKPGNILKFIPKRPAAIIEAQDDRITLDLMKVPQIANNKRLRRVLNIISPLVGIRAIETDRTHLFVALRATPANLGLALAAIRNA
jgi:hypothetical protein